MGLANWIVAIQIQQVVHRLYIFCKDKRFCSNVKSIQLTFYIPRLSENAKHLKLISADPEPLEAVNPDSYAGRTILSEANYSHRRYPESLRFRDELFSAKLIVLLSGL